MISRRIRRYRQEIWTTSVVYKGKLMLIRYRWYRRYIWRDLVLHIWKSIRYCRYRRLIWTIVVVYICDTISSISTWTWTISVLDIENSISIRYCRCYMLRYHKKHLGYAFSFQIRYMYRHRTNLNRQVGDFCSVSELGG